MGYYLIDMGRLGSHLGSLVRAIVISFIQIFQTSTPRYQHVADIIYIRGMRTLFSQFKRILKRARHK